MELCKEGSFFFVNFSSSVPDKHCFIVALSDGSVRLIDPREASHYSTRWSFVTPKRYRVSCLEYDAETPDEVVVAFRDPAMLQTLDLRNIQYSSISGLHTPRVCNSNLLGHSYPISLQPFFSEVSLVRFFDLKRELLASLADGRVMILNKETGEHRLEVSPLSSNPLIQWDGILSRPCRPVWLSDAMYIPCLVRASTSLPVLCFDDLDADQQPTILQLPCEDEVFGCAFSSSLHRMVVSCGRNTLDHRLRVCSLLCFVCLKQRYNLQRE